MALKLIRKLGKSDVVVDGSRAAAGGEWHGIVAVAELDESLGRDGAFEVQMELGFGEIAEPGSGVNHVLVRGGFGRTGHGSSVASRRLRWV